MRIRVHEAPVFPQHIAPLQLIDNERIGILDEAAADHRHRFRETTTRIDRLDERQVVPLPRPVVIRAERRRHVHDTGAIVGRHK